MRLAYAADEVQKRMTPSGDTPLNEYSASYRSQFFKILFVFLLLIVLIILIAWLVRFFSKSRPMQMNQRKNIKILERRPLSNQTFLYHIQIGPKQIILAESKVEVKTVATLDWTDREEESSDL